MLGFTPTRKEKMGERKKTAGQASCDAFRYYRAHRNNIANPAASIAAPTQMTRMPLSALVRSEKNVSKRAPLFHISRESLLSALPTLPLSQFRLLRIGIAFPWALPRGHCGDEGYPARLAEERDLE
jgi:hypothetical protein